MTAKLNAFLLFAADFSASSSGAGSGLTTGLVPNWSPFSSLYAALLVLGSLGYKTRSFTHYPGVQVGCQEGLTWGHSRLSQVNWDGDVNVGHFDLVLGPLLKGA